jgi:hypothetical protein
MDSALDAGGRGPFRGQDAPCARLDYFSRIRRVRRSPQGLKPNSFGARRGPEGPLFYGIPKHRTPKRSGRCFKLTF